MHVSYLREHVVQAVRGGEHGVRRLRSRHVEGIVLAVDMTRAKVVGCLAPAGRQPRQVDDRHAGGVLPDALPGPPPASAEFQ